VTIGLAAKRIAAKGPVAVRISNGNRFGITGRLAGETTKKVTVTGSAKRRVKLRAKSFSAGARAAKRVKLALPKSLRRLLARTGKLRLRLTATVRDPRGNTRRVRKVVTVRLKPKRRR
jgi:hypothetical protein